MQSFVGIVRTRLDKTKLELDLSFLEFGIILEHELDSISLSKHHYQARLVKLSSFIESSSNLHSYA